MDLSLAPPAPFPLSLSALAATGPLPPEVGGAEAERWRHTRLRRRMLDGTHREDVVKALAARVGGTRAQAWSDTPILSTNPYAAICRELSVLYAEPPRLYHDGAAAGDVAELETLLQRAGLWGMMARVQRYTLGLRECLVRIDLEGGKPTFRPVYPDMVIAVPREDQPDQPVRVQELRLRQVRTGRGAERVWTWDVLDVSDPSSPVWEVREVVTDAKAGYIGKDLSGALWGEEARKSGGAYPFRLADGTPFVPYVAYHAERTGDRLWDPWSWIELVEGSLDLVIKSNLLDHAFLQASWPQRWMIGAEVVGAEIDGKRREVITDPATVLQLQKAEGFEGQPTIGQWQPGGDLATMSEVIGADAARLATEAGVSAADLQRLNSQRSGVSISLTNEGKRAQQRRYAGHFRESDQLLVGRVAAMLNRIAGSALPEYGWSVLYRELPLSPDELTARRAHVLELLDKRMLRRVDAFRELNPGLSEAAARAELAKIDAEAAAPVAADQQAD